MNLIILVNELVSISFKYSPKHAHQLFGRCVLKKLLLKFISKGIYISRRKDDMETMVTSTTIYTGTILSSQIEM